MHNNVKSYLLDIILLYCALLAGIYPLALSVIFTHMLSRYYSNKLKNTIFKEIYNVPIYIKNKCIYYLIIVISLIFKEIMQTEYYMGVTNGVIAFAVMQYAWKVYKSFDFGISFSSVIDKAVDKIE